MSRTAIVSLAAALFVAFPVRVGAGEVGDAIFIPPVPKAVCTSPEQSGHPGGIVVTGTNTLGDAAMINAAIAASPKGSEIVFRGTFLLNETIRLIGGRSYRGESRAGTVMKQADGANLVALVTSSVFLDDKTWTGGPMALRHLTLNGNRKNNTEAATAGVVLRSWLSVVEDVYITRMGGDGLRLTNLGVKGAKLNTTQVNGRISGCFIEKSGRHGVFVEDTQNKVTDWILSDNWIASSGADGIHLDNAAGWYVERNHVYGVHGHAIYAHRLFATSIADNYIEGTPRGAGLYYTAEGDKKLIVVSTGNVVENVGTDRFVGNGVTLSAGL